MQEKPSVGIAFGVSGVRVMFYFVFPPSENGTNE